MLEPVPESKEVVEIFKIGLGESAPPWVGFEG
jgi:hypothetical protein